MCTSGIMYMEEDDEPNWLDLQMEEDLAKVDELIDMAKELKERYCSYSGLLSVREYQNLNEEEEC